MAEPDLTRPIIGIENRSAQEVFDIMCDRFKHAASAPEPTNDAVSDERLREACPHCGETRFAKVKPYPWEKEGEDDLVWGYHVICDASGLDTWQRGCGAASGWGETQAEAIASWNRRSVTSQASEGEVIGSVTVKTGARPETALDLMVLTKLGPGRHPLYASPVSKRVERLETKIEALIAAATDARNWLGNAPTGKRVDDAIADLRQALGGRS